MKSRVTSSVAFARRRLVTLEQDIQSGRRILDALTDVDAPARFARVAEQMLEDDEAAARTLRQAIEREREESATR